MTEIRICPRCWRLLEPYLTRATSNEMAHLEAIAKRLARCSRCVSQSGKLIAAARAQPIGHVWDWISGQ